MGKCTVLGGGVCSLHGTLYLKAGARLWRQVGQFIVLRPIAELLSSGQHSPVECTVLCSTGCSTVLWSVQCSAVQCVVHSSGMYSAVQYGGVKVSWCHSVSVSQALQCHSFTGSQGHNVMVLGVVPRGVIPGGVSCRGASPRGVGPRCQS